MNKPAKKPAVVAKTAPKKRGRPIGSTNKRVSSRPLKVDWEKLAKQLQVALSGEMKDNDDQQVVIDNLFAEALRTRSFWERIVILFTGKV